jgi:serine protease AprX
MTPQPQNANRNRLRALLVVGALVVPIATPLLSHQTTATASRQVRDWAPNDGNAESLIVRAAPRQLDYVRAGLQRRGARVTKTLNIINALAVDVALGRRDQIADMRGVVDVAVDEVLTPTPTTAAPPETTPPTAPPVTTPPTAPPVTTPPVTAPTPTVAPTTVAAPATPTVPPTTPVVATLPPVTTQAPTIPTVPQVPQVPPTTLPVPTSTPTDTETTIPSPAIDPVTGAEVILTPTEAAAEATEDAEKVADARAVGAARDGGSLESIARITGARSLWKRGITGRGVDVALIDTGIAPVPGAPTTVNGVDLSLEANNASVRFLDGFGHGTHMAGIIAGHDASVTNPLRPNGGFVGIAPGARVVNVKVGAMDGSVHTSQVVSALDWVVQNSKANGLNIRVVNLSYGSPATPDWQRDPLAWASEVAWRKGILVVAAAGNEGANHELLSPAYSPAILAVGATEVENARGGRNDYTVTAFTSTGTRRRPDLYVPGSHVISLRVKGSFVDTFLAKSNISDQLTRGTGTSQATAVTSGLGALLFEAFPSATPDQIKALLTRSSSKRHGERDVTTGIETNVNLSSAFRKGARRLPTVAITDPFSGCTVGLWCRGNGDGTDPVMTSWAQASWAGSGWAGSGWAGSGWAGSGWAGSGWAGNQWLGSGWAGSGWASGLWLGSGWAGSGWAGSGWAGNQWLGSGWSGSGWSGSGWSGSGWSGSGWNGSGWNGSGWNGSGWNGSGWSTKW